MYLAFIFNIQLMLIFVILYISSLGNSNIGPKLITMLLLLLLLLLGLKGGDYTNYFEAYSSSIGQYTSLLDIFYIISNYFNLTFNEFVATVYVLCSMMIFSIFKRAETSLLFFLISYFPLYILLLQGAFRMGLSVVIALVAIDYLRRERMRTSFFFFLLSIYMHVGSGSILFFYFLYKIYLDYSFKFKLYMRIALVALIALIALVMFLPSMEGYIEKYTVADLDQATGAFFRLALHFPVILIILFNKGSIKTEDFNFIKYVYILILILTLITMLGYLNSTVLDRISLTILIATSMILSFNRFPKSRVNLVYVYTIFITNITIMNSWFIFSHYAHAFWLQSSG